MSDVRACARALVQSVAEGGEIPIASLRELAELVQRSELVAVSQQLLEGPPEFALRRRITASSAEDYSRMRLRAVARPTVAKEPSALRNFLSWAERRHEIDEAPLVRNPPSTCTTLKLLRAAQSLAEPEFWTPEWTPRPAKRPKCIHWYDLSFRSHWVGHPGLEPGANGLRTQRCAAHKAHLLSDSDMPTRPIPVTKGHGSTYSGHRDRLDRAALLRTIAHAREAKIITEDHARTLVALVELVGGRLS